MKIGDEVVHGGRKWLLLDVQGNMAYIAMDKTAGCRQKRVPFGSLDITKEEMDKIHKMAKIKISNDVKEEFNGAMAGLTVAELIKMAEQYGVKPQFIDKATSPTKSTGMQVMQLKNMIRSILIQRKMEEHK